MSTKLFTYDSQDSDNVIFAASDQMPVAAAEAPTVSEEQVEGSKRKQFEQIPWRCKEKGPALKAALVQYVFLDKLHLMTNKTGVVRAWETTVAKMSREEIFAPYREKMKSGSVRSVFDKLYANECAKMGLKEGANVNKSALPEETPYQTNIYQMYRDIEEEKERKRDSEDMRLRGDGFQHLVINKLSMLGKRNADEAGDDNIDPAIGGIAADLKAKMNGGNKKPKTVFGAADSELNILNVMRSRLDDRFANQGKEFRGDFRIMTTNTLLTAFGGKDAAAADRLVQSLDGRPGLVTVHQIMDVGMVNIFNSLVEKQCVDRTFFCKKMMEYDFSKIQAGHIFNVLETALETVSSTSSSSSSSSGTISSTPQTPVGPYFPHGLPRLPGLLGLPGLPGLPGLLGLLEILEILDFLDYQDFH